MRILVDIAHPAQVHFFHNAIRAWQDLGHTVAVTAMDKEITLALLEHFGIAYRQVNTPRIPAWLRPLRMLGRDRRLWGVCKEFRPDVLTAVGGIWAAQVGFLLRRPVVLWDDTEHHKWGHRAAWPFATQVHSPDCYKLPPVRKQRLYAGCHELAYLHPSRFTPQAQIVREMGIDPTERYCVVRLVAWGAQHDVGQHGVEADTRAELIRILAERVRVYITSEAPLPEELASYRLRIPPHQIHHVLAFASLVITEGATMASESALLATPTIYVNTLQAGTIDMFERAGLLRQTTDSKELVELAIDLLAEPDAKERTTENRNRLLAGKIDVTDHVVTTVEQAGSERRGKL